MRTIILALAVLALLGCDRQNAGNSQAGGNAAAPAVPAGAVDRSQAGKPAPDVPFKDQDGEPATLADFHGKPVLVNLWATWCAPCVKELPTLDALSKRPGAPQLLALSQDMRPPAEVAAFLAERKLALEAYQDEEMAMSSALGVTTLPTSVLYASDGKEIWRYTGDLDWTGAEAAELLGEAR